MDSGWTREKISREAIFSLAFILLVAVADARQVLKIRNVSTADPVEVSPIRKVINLIEDMKTQVENEGTEDTKAYEKFACWCDKNEKEKKVAIENAEAEIDRLDSFIKEAAAKTGMLKTEIAMLSEDIDEDRNALATAAVSREDEQKAFQAEETDMKETHQLLDDAIKVLSNVNFVQSGQVLSDANFVQSGQAKLQATLLQVKEKVQSHPKFANSILTRDLYDLLGSLDLGTNAEASPPVFQQAGRRVLASRLLPGQKTDEQKGMEEKPNDLRGAAANSKSYNPRSGRIVGLLTEMRDNTQRNLAKAQKEDFEAEVSFQKLRSAKLGEIAAATENKNQKSASLAELQSNAAKAKSNLESTTDALEADQSFLANLKKDCQEQDKEYKARSEIRGKEIVALSETLKILTEDDARDLFSQSSSFVQLGSTRKAKVKSTRLSAIMDDSTERAMRRIAVVARRHKNWALVSLAVRIRLDSFSKVKEALDKMLAELKLQQQNEYKKRDTCNKEIDKTEDDIHVGENMKEDLHQKHQKLVNMLQQLASEIEELRKDEMDSEVGLKEAGEQRKNQNQLFQTSVSDQRATVNILHKAQHRLQMFYNASFLQEPGQPGEPRPPTPKSYEKSAASGGVLQVLAKVISDAASVEAELVVDEQHDQELYGEFVQATQATIEADRKAIAEKTALTADTEAEKSETEESQIANEQELSSFADLLKARHLDCDWILKYFDLRQKARAEEMDAISDAKAVLSGASFGSK